MQEEAQAGTAKFGAEDIGEGPIIEGGTSMMGCQGAVKEDVFYCMRNNAHIVIIGISTTFMGAMR